MRKRDVKETQVKEKEVEEQSQQLMEKEVEEEKQGWLLLVYKCLNNLEPSYLVDLLLASTLANISAALAFNDFTFLFLLQYR